MDDRLDHAQRKVLHGKDYVAKFERGQSPGRLRRLIDLLDLDMEFDVADFGCGSGMILEYLRDRVASYTGFDFSEEFIAAANRRKNALKAGNAHFECGSLVDICKRYEGAFDVGLAFDISEHVYDDEWQEMINAMFAALKPRGRLYLHTPNADFLLEIMKARHFLLQQFPEHIAVRNAKDNRDFFVRAGFGNISVRFLPHYNILSLIHPLSCVPVVGRYCEARIFIEATKTAS